MHIKKVVNIKFEIYYTAVRKSKKESFYHGILLGLLSHQEEWRIRSSAESGEGYSDILIEIIDDGSETTTGIIIELKYSESRDLETKCLEALRQIEDNDYAEQLEDDDLDTILKYGIACRKKTCMVRMASPQ